MLCIEIKANVIYHNVIKINLEEVPGKCLLVASTLFSKTV